MLNCIEVPATFNLAHALSPVLWAPIVAALVLEARYVATILSCPSLPAIKPPSQGELRFAVPPPILTCELNEPVVAPDKAPPKVK